MLAGLGCQTLAPQPSLMVSARYQANTDITDIFSNAIDTLSDLIHRLVNITSAVKELQKISWEQPTTWGISIFIHYITVADQKLPHSQGWKYLMHYLLQSRSATLPMPTSFITSLPLHVRACNSAKPQSSLHWHCCGYQVWHPSLYFWPHRHQPSEVCRNRAFIETLIKHMPAQSDNSYIILKLNWPHWFCRRAHTSAEPVPECLNPVTLFLSVL